MQPGEIYLARFPFGDVPGMKLRPVLLLTGTVGSVPTGVSEDKPESALGATAA